MRGNTVFLGVCVILLQGSGGFQLKKCSIQKLDIILNSTIVYDIVFSVRL